MKIIIQSGTDGLCIRNSNPYQAVCEWEVRTSILTLSISIRFSIAQSYISLSTGQRVDWPEVSATLNSMAERQFSRGQRSLFRGSNRLLWSWKAGVIVASEYRYKQSYIMGWSCDDTRTERCRLVERMKISLLRQICWQWSNEVLRLIKGSFAAQWLMATCLSVT